MKRLGSLPAPRKLILGCNIAMRVQEERGIQDAALWVARRVMPNLQVLAGSRAAKWSSKQFFEWAFGS